MTAINILLGVVAAILLLFVVGDTNPPMSEAKRRNVTLAFVAVVVLIIAVNTIM